MYINDSGGILDADVNKGRGRREQDIVRRLIIPL